MTTAKTTRFLLSLVLLLTSCAALPATAETPVVCKARWTGEIDDAFAKQVHTDIDSAIGSHCTILQVSLFSPGGSVVDGFEIIRAMLVARERLIIAVHGGGMVASMATLVLAAGTPGYRTIDPNTFTLVHSIRKGYEGTCLSLVANPVQEDDKVSNQLISSMASIMADLTGQSTDVTLDWLKCENSQVGNGWMLVKMGFADKVRR